MWPKGRGGSSPLIRIGGAGIAPAPAEALGGSAVSARRVAALIIGLVIVLLVLLVLVVGGLVLLLTR